MKYPSNIMKLAGAYYTDVRGVVFSILRASGINPAAAYYHAFRGNEGEEICTQKAEKLESGQYIAQLIAALKAAKKTPIIIDDQPGTRNKGKDTREEEKEDKRKVLQTVSGVREELATIAGDISGKDKAAVLVQLAKMLPDDTTPEEKRVIMYLPFNSDCRQCSLFNKDRKG